MASENGEDFLRNLAAFVRTHEKALANALQLRQNRPLDRPSGNQTSPNATQTSFLSAAQSTGVSSLVAAISLGTLHLDRAVKPVKLTLTPHHLFYLLSRFEEIGVDVGPTNVRLENIHADSSPGNYVSFLKSPMKPTSRRGKDSDSVHSVSSIRSVMSNMSSLWTVVGIGAGGTAKSEKARAALESDTKYLYSAFTKIPCLRLSPDRRARLISGYEEFPFDTAVPLSVFKNISALEIYDTDFRQLHGWDRMADQLRSLTIKRGHIDDPRDLLVGIVIDDAEGRRRRSPKAYQASAARPGSASPFTRSQDAAFGTSPVSPRLGSSPRRTKAFARSEFDPTVSSTSPRERTQSSSPTRPRTEPISFRHKSRPACEMNRSGSESSISSSKSPRRALITRSSSHLLTLGILPPEKWQFLRHLSLADNGLTSLPCSSLAPLANSLTSIDLSSNLFVEVPEGLTGMTRLRAANLSDCLIGSASCLAQYPTLAIESLNLRGNRLESLMGLHTLTSLQRVDLRDNLLTDPAELSRLTRVHGVQEVYISGNPLTRTSQNYRVQIFNSFRSEPGNFNDPSIDGSGPSYSERKQLRERAALHVVISKADQQMLAASGEASIAHHPSPASQRLPADVGKAATLTPSMANSEPNAPVKRRQVSRKRVIDLDGAQQKFAPHHEAPQAAPVLPSAQITKPVRPQVDASLDTSRTEINPDPEHEGSPTEPVPINTQPEVPELIAIMSQYGGEQYRQKAEALKQEYGADWLRVLGDNSRHTCTNKAIIQHNSVRHATIT